MAECKEKLDNEPKCESCLADNNKGSKVATFFCSECMDFMCSDCTAGHSENEILKSHTVLEKEGELFNTLRDIKEILYCKEHGNLRVYVCEDHSELICEVCINRNHRNCKKLTKSLTSPQDAMQDISTFSEKVQSSYEQRSRLSVRQKSAMSTQKVLLIDLKNFVEEAVKRNDKSNATEISGLEKEEVSSFISIRHDMVNVVSKLNDSTKEQIVANYIHLSTKERCSSLCDLKDVEQKTMDADEFTKKLALIQRISIDTFQDDVIGTESGCQKTQCDKQTVETQTDPTPDTEHDDAHLNVENIYSTEANIETKREDVGKCGANVRDLSTNLDLVIEETVGGDQYSTGSDSVPGMVKTVVNDASTMTHNVQLVDTESQTNKMDYYKPNKPFLQRSIVFSGCYNICQEYERSCSVSDISLVNRESIVVADIDNGKLKLFDLNFRLKGVVTTQGRPVSVCRITNDRIVVSLDTKSVHTYTVTDTLQHDSQFKLKYHCRCVCTVSANTIALLMSDIPVLDESGYIQRINSGDNKILIEFRNPSNGQILRVIDHFGEKLDTPSFIIQDTSDNIVVGEIDRLSAFNEDGDREWFYKSYKDVKLDGTLGMDIDGEGNIYVCGNISNNIHQVSCMDFRRNRVIIPHVTNPKSVVFDSFNERLIVGLNDDKCICVYDFI